MDKFYIFRILNMLVLYKFRVVMIKIWRRDLESLKTRIPRTLFIKYIVVIYIKLCPASTALRS